MSINQAHAAAEYAVTLAVKIGMVMNDDQLREFDKLLDEAVANDNSVEDNFISVVREFVARALNGDFD